MTQWADFLISEASYDSNHLIKFVKRHKDLEDGFSDGKIVDRLTIASDIKNGFTYFTVLEGLNSWKKGNRVRTFQLQGNPYIRIDENKVTFDNLGQIPELNIDSLNNKEKMELEKSINDNLSSKSNLTELREKQMQETDVVYNESKPVFEKHSTVEKPPQSPRGSLPKDTGEELPQELDLAPESVSEPEPEVKPEPKPDKPPQSPRGSLPKDTGEELPQELDLAPEPEDEKATPKQLARLAELEKQIQELESQPTPEPEDDVATPEQFDKLDDLKKQINDLESALSKLDKFTKTDGDTSKQLDKSIDSEHIDNDTVTKKIQQQNKKLDKIEQKIHSSKSEPQSEALTAYCMKCKTKRTVKDPHETTMKNGRPAVRGVCSKCGTKVFRIIKTK